MKRMSEKASSSDSGVNQSASPSEKLAKPDDDNASESNQDETKNTGPHSFTVSKPAATAVVNANGSDDKQTSSTTPYQLAAVNDPSSTNAAGGNSGAAKQFLNSVRADEETSVDILDIVPVGVAAGSSSSSAAEKCAEKVSLVLVFGKNKYDVSESLDESVAGFKETVAKLTGVPPVMQKLMFKGMLKDAQTLRDAKLTDGCKIMLIGSTPTQVAAANTAPKPEELRQAEAQAVAKEPLCKQKQHAKVLEKGMPDDVMPGIKNARDNLPTAPISGMVNSKGSKVRLTFKLELDQVWLGTKERTDKIMMAQIKDVISEPIEGHEEYHIMGLQLGPTEASRYWLYWVPAQYVAAIKAAIVG